MRLRDLVYLITSPNPCYLTLTKEKPEGVIIHLDTQTWTSHGETRPIGDSPIEFPFPRVVFGVYDRTKMTHLRALVFAVQDITSQKTRGAIYLDR